MEILVFCLVTAVVSIGIVSLYFVRNRKNLVQKLSDTTLALRNFEKEIHQKEIVNIRERNDFESDLNAKSKQLMERIKQDGILIGRADATKEHEIKLKELELAHREIVSKERVLAAEEAKIAQRTEFEQQVKLFSVKISPYVKIANDSGIFRRSNISEVGYQYQLLVNGIPAFAPHIIIETTEELRETDKDAINFYIEKAKTIAIKAADIYLSGAGKGAVHIADAIVHEVKKS